MNYLIIESGIINYLQVFHAFLLLGMEKKIGIRERAEEHSKKKKTKPSEIPTKRKRMQLRDKNESKIGKNEVMDGPNSGEVDVDGTEYFETQENFETQGNYDFE